MKFILIALALTVFSFSASTKEVEINGTNISFTAPENFSAISEDLIRVKWPNKNRPKFVIGNESANTTIAYDLKPFTITEKDLPNLSKSFQETFNRMIPGVQWIKKGIVSLSGRKWVYLELTSSAIDTDIHNIILVTYFNEKMLIFNFNSTREQFPKHESSLRESMNSISFNINH